MWPITRNLADAYNTSVDNYDVNACVPRQNPVHVELRERDVDARLLGAVEQIVALDVAWVQTGEVGWRERAVRRRVVVESERAVLFQQTNIQAHHHVL